MTTPMMQQWHKCKYQAKDALLLFRLGDFYEAFYDDAQILSKKLDLTLTKRQGTPMCGVPHHTVQNYIDRLIALDLKVAIAEQISESEKDIMTRKVVRFVTPATTLHSSKSSENNFFVALESYDSFFALAVLDISTSEFKGYIMESLDDIATEIYRISPRELLTSQRFYDKNCDFIIEMSHKMSFLLTANDKFFNLDERLSRAYLSSFWKDFDDLEYSIVKIAASLLKYFEDELLFDCHTIPKIFYAKSFGCMKIDITTLESLDVLPHKKSSMSLLKYMNKTKTPMGSRLIADWLKHPLVCRESINKRLDALSEIIEKTENMSKVSSILSNISDIQRILVKTERKIVNPKQLLALASSLDFSKELIDIVGQYESDFFKYDVGRVFCPNEVSDLIKKAISDDPPVKISDCSVIRHGYNDDLDKMRLFSEKGRSWLVKYQKDLREDLGIKTLKVSYNKVFGYYIEVSKGQASKLKDRFIKKQTLVNTERFISDDLKEFEAKILTIEDKIKNLEEKLYYQLLESVLKQNKDLLDLCFALSKVDAIFSLADLACKNNLVSPVIHEGLDLSIEGGRHPLLESTVEFVPNNVSFDKKENLYLVTGPNMGGKSTYIRQTALIVIMAQVGSFVPAKKAEIGIVDKVFSRIGASDDISIGDSTFMVEMKETAFILKNMTSRSLILLDEIGRGTSTSDGVAIAWAVAEYILTTTKAKTLFTTHYLELTDLENRVKGAVNYRVDVAEIDDSIVFLHKIVKGAADNSYGLEVARLAGLPSECLKIADNMLQHAL